MNLLDRFWSSHSRQTAHNHIVDVSGSTRKRSAGVVLHPPVPRLLQVRLRRQVGGPHHHPQQHSSSLSTASSSSSSATSELSFDESSCQLEPPALPRYPRRHALVPSHSLTHLAHYRPSAAMQAHRRWWSSQSSSHRQCRRSIRSNKSSNRISSQTARVPHEICITTRIATAAVTTRTTTTSSAVDENSQQQQQQQQQQLLVEEATSFSFGAPIELASCSSWSSEVTL